MHMADALISPAVAGSCWTAALALLAHAARRVRASTRESLIPLMGVLGAFVFAAQMINVSIPGTGSSGHIGGGLLLAVLLGPHAALLTIASVLTVQALLFADGGLLALGCNILNLGFFPAFIAYPWIYKPLARGLGSSRRNATAAIAAAVAGLLMGAFGVVLETTASGITALPFGTFTLLMLPIHLAIGLFEGVATAAVLAFVARTRPDLDRQATSMDIPAWQQPHMVGLLVATLALAGMLSWFASSQPDGLEWSVERVAGQEPALASSPWHARASTLQEKAALLPDYALPTSTKTAQAAPDPAGAAWPAVDAGTSVAGIVGGLVTLLLAGTFGWVARHGTPSARPRPT